MLKNHAVTLGAVATLALVGTACESETTGPETGADVEDIQQNEPTADDADGDEADGEDTVFEDTESYIGEEVTVSATVTEVLSPFSFRLTGEDVGGEPLLVLSATSNQDLEQGESVRVTGTVRVVEEGVFDEEEDFGDEFFTDAGFEDEQAFFDEFGGENAIFASDVEMIQEQ